MKSNVDWLILYKERLKELEEIKKEHLGAGAYDEVEFAISPNATIEEIWRNSENGDSKSYKFKLSRIQMYSENIRKKVEYWKNKSDNKHGENKK